VNRPKKEKNFHGYGVFFVLKNKPLRNSVPLAKAALVRKVPFLTNDKTIETWLILPVAYACLKD
jgi:hypothetical protein